jgi:hypothetical protein
MYHIKIYSTIICVPDIHFAGTMGSWMCIQCKILQSSRWPDNVALHFGPTVLRATALLPQLAEVGISQLLASSKWPNFCSHSWQWKQPHLNHRITPAAVKIIKIPNIWNYKEQVQSTVTYLRHVKEFDVNIQCNCLTEAQNCSANQEKETNGTQANLIYTDWDWCQHQPTNKLDKLNLILFIPCIVIVIIYIDKKMHMKDIILQVTYTCKISYMLQWRLAFSSYTGHITTCHRDLILLDWRFQYKMFICIQLYTW